MKKLFLNRNFIPFILLTLLVCINDLNAQDLPYMWSYKFGSSSFDRGNGITTDGSGSIISVGRFQGTVDFEPGAGTTSFNTSGIGGYIQKLNGAGDLIWIKEILPTASNRYVLLQAVVTDALGNIYVAGHFNNQADFQPGTGSNILSGAAYDGVVIKMDSDGEVLWVKQFESNLNVNLNDLVLDASNNIYITGRHQGTIDLDPGAGVSSATASSSKYRLLLIKLDSDGDFISGYSTMESSNMDAYDIELDNDGDIFIAGHYFSSISVQFAGATALNTSSVSVSGFVASIDASTETRNFFHKFDGSGADYATSVSFNSSDEMFVGGYFDGDIDLNPSGAGSWNYTSNGGDDGFIARFNSLGNFSRGARVGGSSDDQIIKVIADTDVVHAIGTFQGTVDLDPYTGTQNETASATDGFVWTLNSLPTVLTLNRAQVFTSTGDVTMSDYVRNGDSDIITGAFVGTLDADPSASTASHVSSSGSADIFQVRLGTNNDPTNITLSSSNINENNSINATVGTLSTTDADAGDSHSYSLVSGTGDSDNASFNISGSSLRIGISSNHEVKDTYSVRIQTEDGNGGSYAEAFTITINDLAETPTDILLTSDNINENSSGVFANLSVADEDATGTHTYSLVEGSGDSGNSFFSINNDDLSLTASLNHEKVDQLSVRIRATDDVSGTNIEEAFTIFINDVAEAPTDVSLSSTSILENLSAGSTVGLLSTTDQDAGESYMYTLVSGTGDKDNSSFSIVGGQLRSGEVFDRETKSTYSIRINTNDGNRGSFSKSFTITISNVPETPTDISLDNTSIDENEAIGTIIGTFSTTDVDAGETYTYTFATGTGDTDNGSFTIDGSELKSAAMFDFETKDTYSVRINTNDGNGENFDKSFTISINDLEEAIVWNGTSWSNGTGPNAGGNDVVINGDYNVDTDGYFDSRDLTVNSGFTLTVDGDNPLIMQGNLINNGSIVVESGSSLVTYSPNTITGNDITFKRNTRYSDGRYSFVGSPVEQDVSITGSDLGNHVYKYNEATAYGADGLNRWEDASADELVPGKGYTQADKQEIVFTGMPNQGTITIDGTFNEVGNDDHEGWVLVSNPYPAAIDVADFLGAAENDNIMGTIYIWDDNGSNSQRGTNADYITANGTMVTNTLPTPAGGASRYDQIMGSMQGFFVKLIDDTDTEVTFKEDMRVTSGNTDDHFFREIELPLARINLTNNDGLFKQAVIGFAEDATNSALNRTYDGQAFNSTSDNGLFTMKAGRTLSLNGMTKDWEVIQLQLNTAEAGIYQISVELEAYDQAIYLGDKLTGEITDLRTDSYTFTSQAGINSERFELISSPAEVLGLGNDKVMVYALNKILHIKQEENEPREYQLFNMKGQMMLSRRVESHEDEIDLSSYSKGIYLVFDGQKTHKIILD